MMTVISSVADRSTFARMGVHPATANAVRSMPEIADERRSR